MLFTKKSSSPLPWKLLTIEAVLVVLSVLLALALNSWRESRAQQDLAQQALQGVVDEVQINCSRIQSVQEYHREVAEGEAEPGGIRSGFLRNDAWDVAKSTGAAAHLDHEIAAKVGEISAHQGDQRSIIQAYLQALFTIGLQVENVEQWHGPGERGVIRELVNIQSTLMENYRELLVMVEKQYGGAIETDGVCPEQ